MSDLQDILFHDGLTCRQAEIAELFYRGVGYKKIGIQLGILRKSVTYHMQNIYWALDVHSQAELIAYCKRRLDEQTNTCMDTDRSEQSLDTLCEGSGVQS